MNTSTANNLTDKHLVDKVLSGDNRAFGSIIKNTERMVAQIVFKMISDPGDRKDLAQDIYLKAYKQLPSFRFQSKLSTWIARISYNTCIDYLRKKKLLVTSNMQVPNDRSDDMTGEITNKAFADTDGSADILAMQKDLAELLRMEIGKLSPVYRTLITLYHNEELSYEEIGSITGLPSGSIKSYLFRARKTLKDNLLANYQKEDL